MLLIDKPAGISSFDIIRALRRQTGLRKFGHTGTLDPMATGLMLILVGAATKQAGRLTKLDKTYHAEMTLGATSSTGDKEGIIARRSDRQPSRHEIEVALQRFSGPITQTPSAFSAIKINGQRAYKLAREGKPVAMPAREVVIHELKLLDYEYPAARLEASVSSGTYIRTLAEDIGKALGTGAYLTALRRTCVGDYSIDQASPPNAIGAENLAARLIKI